MCNGRAHSNSTGLIGIYEMNSAGEHAHCTIYALRHVFFSFVEVFQTLTFQSPADSSLLGDDIFLIQIYQGSLSTNTIGHTFAEVTSYSHANCLVFSQ